MAHIADNDAEKRARIDRLRSSARSVQEPAIARANLLKAAELERELDTEGSDVLEKGARWTRGADGTMTGPPAPAAPSPGRQTSPAIAAYEAAASEVRQLEKMANDFHHRDPGLARAYREKAAAAAERLEELKVGLTTKDVQPDLAKRVRTAITEGLAPTVNNGHAVVRQLRAQAAPLPPIGMPARPGSSQSTPVDGRPPVRHTPPSLRSPADRVAFHTEKAAKASTAREAADHRRLASEARREI